MYNYRFRTIVLHPGVIASLPRGQAASRLTEKILNCVTIFFIRIGNLPNSHVQHHLLSTSLYPISAYKASRLFFSGIAK